MKATERFYFKSFENGAGVMMIQAFDMKYARPSISRGMIGKLIFGTSYEFLKTASKEVVLEDIIWFEGELKGEVANEVYEMLLTEINK